MADDNIVWMTVKQNADDTALTGSSFRFRLCVDGGDAEMLGVHAEENESVRHMSAKVWKMLGRNGAGHVLQLRNSRGSFVPLNGKLAKNSKNIPYILEVVQEHQRVKPQPRSVKADTYASTILNQTQIFLSRISNLENSIPELKVKREEKIKQDVRELEDQLNFLQKRFNEADQTQWTGLLKKSPLW